MTDYPDDSAIEDRLDCINRNMVRFRPDIREIVREEIKAVVEEALFKVLRELQRPRQYFERGYRE